MNINTSETESQLQYTIINHTARQGLGLTMMEYCVADSIYHLSNNPKSNGICTASKKYLADFLGISERYVFEIINGIHNKKETKQGLIEKGIVVNMNPDDKQHPALKTTSLWYDTTIMNKVQSGSEQSAYPKGERSEQSAYNNDNDNNDMNKDNVSRIESLFKFFKIPKKDKAIWKAVYKNEKDYLLRQLLYAKVKMKNVDNPVKWIQAALSNDYESSSKEAIDRREEKAQDNKDQENYEARGFATEFDEIIGGLANEMSSS